MKGLMAPVVGAIVGGIVAVALFMGTQMILPERYSATVLLFSDDAQVDAGGLRSTLATMIEDPGFLPAVVNDASIPIPIAAELARSIRVEPARESSTLTQLIAIGHPGDELAQAVDAVAAAMVDARRKARSSHVMARLDDIERLVAALEDQRNQASARLRDAVLPSWARSAAIVLAVLDAQRFGLQLRAQLGLESARQVASKDADIQAQLERLQMIVGGTPAVTSQQLDAARQLASIDGKLAQLLAIQQELMAYKVSDRDLRLVRGAQTQRLVPPRRRIAYAALLGAIAGGLSMIVLRVGTVAAKPQRDGPMLESSLSVRVIGALPRALSDYGERKLRPLAQTHPQHLAIDGLRSVRTALRVLASDHAQPGPVVMANADDTQNAGHVLANLAMLDAESGYRVLLVETQQSGSVLSSLFTTGTRTTLSITMDAAELDDASHEFRGNGRIRFVVADDENLGGPPVPGAFISYFDRVYIRAESVERAAALLNIYDYGTGVLAGSHQLGMRQWREARDRWRSVGDTLHGLIQCGHRIDERAYVAVTNA
jgi:hypothetical protein